MSMNENMEVTRKVGPEESYWKYWMSSKDSDDIDYELRNMRECLMHSLGVHGVETLNEGLKWLHLRQSYEGLTLGWEFDEKTTKEDLVTWSYIPGGWFEATFHNLKDVSNLYKPEEELA